MCPIFYYVPPPPPIQVVAQTPYTNARDVSVELKVYSTKTLIVIPSTFQPRVHTVFFLSFSVQCDLFPRGIPENGKIDRMDLKELHSTHDVLSRFEETNIKTNSPTLREYCLRRSHHHVINVQVQVRCPA